VGSDLTWQAALGLGYATGHAEAFAAYRHLDYDLGSSARLESLDFDGPGDRRRLSLVTINSTDTTIT